MEFTKIEGKLIKLVLTDNEISDNRTATKLGITEEGLHIIRNKLAHRLIKYIKKKKIDNSIK